ncbi:MAG: COX15/CtaA family protein [Planctomycetales bacterium]
MTPLAQSEFSPWPNRMAWLLVAATFVLMCVGALVTTLKAGLAVPDWPTTFGFGMFSYPLSTWWNGSLKVFVEHGHRLMGSLVGMITIALVVVVWRCDSRNWVRATSVLALFAVIVQGILGGMRVTQRSDVLAMIHGCSAQAFFGLCVALAVFTSSLWRTREPQSHPGAGKLRRLAALTAALTYLQIVLGAQLRHFPSIEAVYFHLGTAAAVAAHVLALAWRVWRNHGQEPALARPALLLALLLISQAVLGVSAWISKYGGLETYRVTAYGPHQVLSTTGHAVVGGLVLGTVLALALRSFRLLDSQLDSPDSTALETA